MSMLIPNVEELVAANHPYREILSRLNFSELTKPLRKLYSEIGRGGYAIEQGFKCLVLQFMEDLSDREAERMLKENLAAKLFCGSDRRDSGFPPQGHSLYTPQRRRDTGKLIFCVSVPLWWKPRVSAVCISCAPVVLLLLATKLLPIEKTQRRTMRENLQ